MTVFSLKSTVGGLRWQVFPLKSTSGGLRHHFFRQILPSEASDAIFFTKPYRRRPPAMVFRRATRSNDFFS